ncbi:MAG TPA: hypothetical protein V6D14_01700 [Coleofasciculaceae cyanobacterium]|jgi:hypothetical protein
MLYQTKCKQFFKLAIVGVGAFWLLTPSVEATALVQENSKVQSPVLTSTPIKLAQREGCPKAQPVESYETKNFWVYICKGQDGSLFYQGVNKSNEELINVSDVTYEGDDNYTAKNGNTTYQVSPNALLVYQDDKLILEQPMIRRF